MLLGISNSYSQNITNTLGTGGIFSIKDGSKSFLTLDQSNGYLSINNCLSLSATTDSGIGVIYKNGKRFLHDFGDNNIFLGLNSGNFTMSGIYNIAIGSSSLFYNLSGGANTAIGLYSLYHNTTGNYNTAVGYYSLDGNTTGEHNSAFGNASLYTNGGSNNSSFGSYSLSNNYLGSSNSGFGAWSLNANNTGYLNSAFGYKCLNSNQSGSLNSAFGSSALYNNNSGKQNTALGYIALYNNISGFQNTAVGDSALYNNLGNYNTALGYNAGSNVTTGANLTLIGIDANPSSPTAFDEITFGNQYVQTLRCNTTTITSLSDARDKKNIKDLSLGLEFLMKIQPRQFNWDRREWYSDGKSDGSKIQDAPTAGFIAQELDKAQTEAEAEWLKLVLKENPDRIEASSGNLFPIVVKAVQDLKLEKDNEIAQLKSENLKLKNELESIKELQLRLAKLEQVIINSDVKFSSNITE